jgi:Flp pilus assembly pilin Flp
MEMQSISGMHSGMLQFVQDEDGISFIECALVASLAAVVAGIAFLAFSKRT